MIPAAPPPVDPDDARSRIRDELAKSEYDDSEGFVAWLLRVIEEWLLSLADGIDGSSTAQAAIAIVLLLLLGAVVVLVLRRTGLIRRGAVLSVASALDAEPVLSAGELRDSAHRAIAEERFDDATVLALRSLVRDLEVRTLLDVTVGMTAHEAAASASHSFPDLTSRLQRGADAFDTAAYSHRAVTAKQAEDLLRLTEYIAESTPDLTDSEPAEGDQFAGVAP